MSINNPEKHGGTPNVFNTSTPANYRVKVATVYYSDNQHGSILTTRIDKLIPIMSRIITDDTELTSFARYVADEFKSLFPTYVNRGTSDEQTLVDLGFRIFTDYVDYDTYLQDGNSPSDINIHTNPYKYLSQMYHLEVCMTLDEYATPIIERVTMWNSFPGDTEDQLSPRVEIKYSRYEYKRPYHHSIYFPCLCNLIDVVPEDFTKTIESTINTRLATHVIPKLETFIHKLPRRITHDE